jgi:hypothetical protein
VTKTTNDRTRTITLTSRPPVRIVEDEWPIIAQASGYTGEHECQANRTWTIKVRKHADGRHLVYGVLRRGPGGMPIGWRGWAGGSLLAADAGISAVISSIHGCAAGIGDHALAEEAIADLPPESL